MTQPMMHEAAKNVPHIMKPMMMASTGFVAARALGAKPVGALLRSPLLLLAAGAAVGAAAGYLGYRYRKEIVQAVVRLTDMSKDFAAQQKESLDDLIAEAKEGNEAEAKAAAAAEPPAVP